MAKDFFLLRWAKLYSNPTDAEAAIEPAIAALGIPYRFQHPIWGLRLFPDFVLQGPKIVIEIDDESHNTKKKKAEDEERTRRLNRAGWRVVRMTNEEAMEDPNGNLRRVLEPLLPKLYKGK